MHALLGEIDNKHQGSLQRQASEPPGSPGKHKFAHCWNMCGHTLASILPAALGLRTQRTGDSGHWCHQSVKASGVQASLVRACKLKSQG